MRLSSRIGRLNPFAVERWEFTTRLTPEECRDRLLARRFPWGGRLWPGRRLPPEPAVYGRISARGFVLWKHEPASLDGLNMTAAGRFVPTPEATRVEVRVGTNRRLDALAALVAMVFLAGLFGLVGVPDVVAGVAALALWPAPWAGSATLGRRRGAYLPAFYRRFLAETLEAEGYGPNGGLGGRAGPLVIPRRSPRISDQART